MSNFLRKRFFERCVGAEDMSVLVALSSPNNEAESSAPRRIVAEHPDIEIQVIHIDRKGFTAVPYLWVRNVRPKKFESAAQSDPNVHEVKLIDKVDDGALFKLFWGVDSPLIHCVIEADGIIIDANGTIDKWSLKLLFEYRADASDFQECCQRRGAPMEIHRLSSIAERIVGESVYLSRSQRKTLLLAYERGYFDEPRTLTQQELAYELDISTSAVGRRLRRGFRNLIEESLIE